MINDIFATAGQDFSPNSNTDNVENENVSLSNVTVNKLNDNGKINSDLDSFFIDYKGKVSIGSLSETFKDFQKEFINLEIPIYQRLYLWDKNNIIEMFNDINEFKPSDKNPVYFLNDIILVKNDNNSLLAEICDGQQRLTSIMLFLTTIRNEIARKGYNVDKEQMLSIEDTLKYMVKSYTFNGSDFANILNIIQSGEPTDEHNNLATNLSVIENIISELSEEDFFAFLDNFLNRTCLGIKYYIGWDGPSLFYNINNSANKIKGVEMSLLDNCKARVYSHVGRYNSEEEKQMFNTSWNEHITVSNSNALDFLNASIDIDKNKSLVDNFTNYFITDKRMRMSDLDSKLSSFYEDAVLYRLINENKSVSQLFTKQLADKGVSVEKINEIIQISNITRRIVGVNSNQIVFYVTKNYINGNISTSEYKTLIEIITKSILLQKVILNNKIGIFDGSKDKVLNKNFNQTIKFMRNKNLTLTNMINLSKDEMYKECLLLNLNNITVKDMQLIGYYNHAQKDVTPDDFLVLKKVEILNKREMGIIKDKLKVSVKSTYLNYEGIPSKAFAKNGDISYKSSNISREKMSEMFNESYNEYINTVLKSGNTNNAPLIINRKVGEIKEMAESLASKLSV